jgi:ATP:ADP antiporter, AAA family
MKIATRLALLQWQANPANPANLWRLVVAWITPGQREGDERQPLDRGQPAAEIPLARPTIPYRLLRRVIAVEPAEAEVVLWCWLYIFAVLSSYYVMRPIRDAMGVAGGVNNLQWLFTGTLIGMLLLNLPFAWLVKTLPRSRFIPLAYRFFMLNILLFAVALYAASPEQTVWIGRVFFIWASVYNLFVVSIFWQLNVDLFSPEQGKRLFGFIAAGATIGAIVGSGFVAGLGRYVPATALLIGAAVLLEVAVFAAGRLARLSPALHHRPAEQSDAERPLGGGVLSGICHAVSSPYLLNVSLFILLFAVTSTFLYFQQAGIVAKSFTDRGAQTAFFATLDLAVNCLTLAVQLFLTGRIVVLFGVALALAFLPALTIVGFGGLAAMPGLTTIAVFQVVRRASDYAIARPTREVLFTVVAREDRYKAKSFIDTFVYRLGDQVGAWSMAGLRLVGDNAATVALVAIPVAALWLLNALWLGRRQAAIASVDDRRLS